jgi:hypothetical protein
MNDVLTYLRDAAVAVYPISRAFCLSSAKTRDYRIFIAIEVRM